MRVVVVFVPNFSIFLREPCRIIKHVSQEVTLSPDQFFQLANFLGQLANWCQRMLEMNIELCVFCRNNNEPFNVYTSHRARDRFGRVTCPILRQFVCPVCGGTGDRAHTIRYCPKLRNQSIVNTSARRSPVSCSSPRPSSQLVEAGLLDPSAFFP
ncbi:putative nanos RNA binding domain [Fasciolopsis buskii]|uniref:Putative nanos RNA binding domain n=1 Tax=Fasciolopsis buskii TaxID=27845 RepID=A0A8E0VPM9_9TREM|nr:putative nanos RNA binding domain [Fasciolopsis buski]